MDINRVYKAITDDLYIFWEYAIRQNGLGNSKLLKEANITYTTENLFLLVFPDYVEYVNSGRRGGAKMPPTDAIVEWARSKGIPTDNGTIWKIRKGIAEDGIKPRPVLDMIFDLAEEEWNSEWAEEIFNEIISDLIKWFE